MKTPIHRPPGLAVFNTITMPDGLTQSRARPFFNRASGRAFGVRSAGAVTEIELYDEIGFWGVSASDFRERLRDVKGGTIKLSINSPGGDVFDGIAIYNDLKSHAARVEVHVTGLAASAASLIAMAGDSITVASNAFLMIHNAWTVAIGDKAELRQVADVLAQIDGSLAETYAARTGQAIGDVVAMMDAETWLNGDEAKAKGFADATGPEASAKAAFDLSCFNRVPDGLRARMAVAGPATPRDFERALRDAGASKNEAVALVAGGFKATGRRESGAGNPDLTAALKRLHASIKH